MACFDFLWIKRLFRWAVLSLPASVRFALTLVAFWPTVLWNRAVCWFAPRRRQLWNRVDPAVVLGSVPLTLSDVRSLVREHRVTAVVNLCREWDSGSLARAAGVQYLHLPTIDYDVPALEDCISGAAFIHRFAQSGETVYVHCKAGRGRSAAVVYAYLVLHRSMRCVPVLYETLTL